MTSRPHIDKKTFKQIFHEHWDEFKRLNPRYNTSYHSDVIQKMLDCGDPAKMGHISYLCTGCGHTHQVAMSCKSSFCLSCAKPYTDRWVEFIGRRLIPGVTYRHVVLTVPDFLQIHFYRNRELLGPFMQLAMPCLKDVFKTAFGIQLDIGLVVVLQTFGRPGTFNVHLHVIVSSGGITASGQWRQVGYIPFTILHRKWQYHLLTFLKQRLALTPQLARDIDRGWRNYPSGFVANVQKGKVPGGGKGLARYLAKYVVSPPISVRRIEVYDGQNVRYWYHDHKTMKIKVETVPASTFIGRMVQHILPKGFQRIRYYGFQANARYAATRPVIIAILPRAATTEDPLGYRVISRKPFQMLFWETYGRDPLICPHCGSQMEVDTVWHPKYGIIRQHTHSHTYKIAS